MKQNILLVGYNGIGKGKIASLLFNKVYDDNYPPTRDFDISYYQIKIQNEIIQINFWYIINWLSIFNLYNKVSLAIIVYSTDYRSSLKNVGYLCNRINEHSFDCIKFLVGNNTRSEEFREVPKLNEERYNQYYGFDLLMEVSSVTGYNIENLKKI